MVENLYDPVDFEADVWRRSWVSLMNAYDELDGMIWCVRWDRGTPRPSLCDVRDAFEAFRTQVSEHVDRYGIAAVRAGGIAARYRDTREPGRIGMLGLMSLDYPPFSFDCEGQTQ